MEKFPIEDYTFVRKLKIIEKWKIITKYKVLFICHGKKLLFWKNVGKARVVGV